MFSDTNGPFSSSLDTPTACPTIRFNSDAEYLELVSDSIDSRVQSRQTAPTSDTSHGSGASHTSDQPVINGGFL